MLASWDALTGRSNPSQTDWRRVPALWRALAARRSGRLWARDLVSTDDWLLLDTETTGTRGNAEVVQVAVVHPSGSTLFEACVRPQEPMPPEAAAIHGLGDELLRGALPFPIIHQALVALLEGKRVVAYNAAFDARLLSQTAKRYGLGPLEVSWDCAMLAYASFNGEWVAERGSFKWPRLPGAAHGAAADCRATLELIRHMARRPDSPWWRFW